MSMMRAILCDHEDASENLLRLSTLFNSAGGVVAYTDYSGYDCPRESARLGVQAARELFPDKEWKDASFRRACDVAPLQATLLTDMAHQLDAGGSCVFGDIMDRLPEAALARIMATLESCSVDKDDSDGGAAPVPELTAEAYQEIDSYLKQNSDCIFNVEETSACSVHGKECPVHPLSQLMYPKGSRTRRPTVAQAASRPFAMCIAGVSCIPWTTEGEMKGDTSPEQLPFLVWIHERRARATQLLEDVFPRVHTEVSCAEESCRCSR